MKCLYLSKETMSLLVQLNANDCTTRTPHFVLSLYFSILIKHIFASSCYEYLRDVRDVRGQKRNLFSNIYIGN